MNLVSFSVQNFRSITKAHRLHLGQSTILIGPNNEGKSNILRSLVMALDTLEGMGEGEMHIRRGRIMYSGQRHSRFDARYDWSRDYPVHLQNKQPDGESIFTCEFQLTDTEIDDFWKEVKSQLNGNLSVQLSLGKKGPGFRVLKRGPGAKALSQKPTPIARFIAKRLNCQYIQAVRTAQAAQEVVDDMVERELQSVEKDPRFRAAIAEIGEVQKPILQNLEKSIGETLAVFLSEVKAVRIQILENERYQALRRSCAIVVDDGTPTLLKYKGDGVQSLAALSLMRHASVTGSTGQNLIIAIEEPESHLHPNAIHKLKGVLRELAQKHRIVITTHCPLFVDRSSIRNNIIVSGNKAHEARSIQQIRDILGVRASDNLQHAELVLLVEGEEDAVALDAIFRHESPQLKASLEQGALAIDTLNGGSNLSYKLGLVHNALCVAHCFLDHDKAGIDAANRAKADGLISDGDLNFATCQGMPESEIEDLYDVQAYQQMIMTKYRVSLDSPRFKGRGKWSDRMRETFKAQGKLWDDTMEMQVKRDVAEVIKTSPATALNQHKRHVVDALVQVLVQRLQEAPTTV